MTSTLSLQQNSAARRPAPICLTSNYMIYMVVCGLGARPSASRGPRGANRHARARRTLSGPTGDTGNRVVGVTKTPALAGGVRFSRRCSRRAFSSTPFSHKSCERVHKTQKQRAAVGIPYRPLTAAPHANRLVVTRDSMGRSQKKPRKPKREGSGPAPETPGSGGPLCTPHTHTRTSSHSSPHNHTHTCTPHRGPGLP